MFGPWNDPFNMFGEQHPHGFHVVRVQRSQPTPPQGPGRHRHGVEPFTNGESGESIPEDRSVSMLKFLRIGEWGWVDHESVRIDCHGRCWVNSEYYVFTEPPRRNPLQPCYGPPAPGMVALKRDESGWIIDIRFTGFHMIEREGEPGPFISKGKTIMDEMTGRTPGNWDEPVMRVYY